VNKARYILKELGEHAPFTFFGAILGILFMLVFQDMGESRSRVLFDVFHPAHVLLSAVVTAAIYRLHGRGANFILVLLVGYVGAVGVATLSDCLIPYLGEWLLGFQEAGHGQGGGAHIGFIERWYIVNPAALLGVVIAYFWPRTKLPHAGHVLLSIWASLFHILMALGEEVSVGQWAVIFVFLFIAVLLPCCISDIIFPLLFVKQGEEPPPRVH